MVITLRFIFVSLLFALIGLQMRFWVGDGGVREYQRLKVTLTDERGLLDALEDRNDQLEAEVKDLKHHLSAIEERARTDLGMIRRGEVYYPNLDAPK